MNTIEKLNDFGRQIKELHSLFHEKRVRGEWFDLNGSDLRSIREYFNCEEL